MWYFLAFEGFRDNANKGIQFFFVVTYDVCSHDTFSSLCPSYHKPCVIMAYVRKFEISVELGTRALLPEVDASGIKINEYLKSVNVVL